MNNISDFRKNRVLQGKIIAATPTHSTLSNGSKANAALSTVLWMITLFGIAFFGFVAVRLVQSIIGG